MHPSTDDNSFFLKLSEWLVRWRYLLMIACLTVVLIGASGVRFIGFATDYEIWFGDDNPQLLDFKHLQDNYGKSDNVIFIVTAENGDIFTSENLKQIKWLTKQSWQIPYSTRVDSVTNFQYTSAEDDDLLVENLVPDADDISNEELAQIKQIALSEPALINNAISADASVTAINVTIDMPDNLPEGSPEVTAFARSLLTELNQKSPHLKTHLTGLIIANNAFIEATKKDMGSLNLIMLVVILVGLAVALRSVVAVVSVLLMVILAMLATMGIGGWMAVKLTPVSMGATTVVMTIVVANSVHILLALMHSMASGMDKRAALVESLRVNLQPVFLTTLTTVIGFLSMNFAEVPPFHDLGNMASLGVIIASLLSIALLPVLVLLLPMRVAVKQNNQNILMSSLASLLIARRHWILGILITITLFFALMIPKNQITEKTWEYFDKSVEFRVDTDYASEKLIGPYFLQYSLETNEENGISNPLFLKQVDSFKEWLLTQSEVVHVNAISDVFKRLNKNMHADDPDWYRLPESKELAAQYLLLYEMSLPFGFDTTNQINLNHSGTRVFASLHNQSSVNMIKFNQRAEAWLEKNIPGINVVSGSPMYMFAHIGQRAANNMIEGVMFALILISLVLIIALRSFKIGLLSLIPNFIPLIVAFGMWGLFIQEVSVALTLGLGMTLGIIVDDTVHFLSKYLRARKEQNLSVEDAVRYALSHVGVALIITTAVLIAGFLILASSSFKQNHDLGVIASLIIGLALAIDLFLLPVLLLVFDRKKEIETETLSNEPANKIDAVNH